MKFVNRLHLALRAGGIVQRSTNRNRSSCSGTANSECKKELQPKISQSETEGNLAEAERISVVARCLLAESSGTQERMSVCCRYTRVVRLLGVTRSCVSEFSKNQYGRDKCKGSGIKR